MHTGMLWFENGNGSLLEKVSRGMDYYVKKYGRKPDLILVHPSMLEAGQTKLEIEIKTETRTTSTTDNRIESVIENQIHKITVRGYRPVLPGHIWIGIEDKS